jgi:hypothetical protein
MIGPKSGKTIALTVIAVLDIGLEIRAVETFGGRAVAPSSSVIAAALRH